MTVQAYPAVQLANNSINGFPISYASTTTITVGSGICWDSNNVVQIVLGSTDTIGQTTDVPYTINAAINGAGGLDTGTFAAGGTYYVLAIADSYSNNFPAALISLSATAPSMPYGYDSFRVIGAVESGATAIFRPFDMKRAGALASFQYRTPIIMTAGTSATSATINLTEVTSGYVAVPITGLYKVHMNIAYTPTTATNVLSIKGYDGAAVTTSNTQYNFTGTVSAQVQNEPCSLIVGLNSGVPAVTYLIGTAGSQTISIVGYDMGL